LPVSNIYPIELYYRKQGTKVLGGAVLRNHSQCAAISRPNKRSLVLEITWLLAVLIAYSQQNVVSRTDCQAVPFCAVFVSDWSIMLSDFTSLFNHFNPTFFHVRNSLIPLWDISHALFKRHAKGLKSSLPYLAYYILSYIFRKQV